MPATRYRTARAFRGEERLSLVFRALSDATRRRILQRLAIGPATVTELARPFEISLPAISRHLKMLERSGFIRRTVDGRVHSCALNPEPLDAVNAWTSSVTQFWEDALARLADFAERKR